MNFAVWEVEIAVFIIGAIFVIAIAFHYGRKKEPVRIRKRGGDKDAKKG